MTGSSFEFDVVFSFAGENRALVEPIAERLRAQGISVFYDAYEQANLWGGRMGDVTLIRQQVAVDLCAANQESGRASLEARSVLLRPPVLVTGGARLSRRGLTHLRFKRLEAHR
jgi:hypothetical protein